jgi:hypothetical protein
MLLPSHSGLLIPSHAWVYSHVPRAGLLAGVFDFLVLLDVLFAIC